MIRDNRYFVNLVMDVLECVENASKLGLSVFTLSTLVKKL
jgi:hypothetical protein